MLLMNVRLHTTLAPYFRITLTGISIIVSLEPFAANASDDERMIKSARPSMDDSRDRGVGKIFTVKREALFSSLETVKVTNCYRYCHVFIFIHANTLPKLALCVTTDTLTVSFSVALLLILEYRILEESSVQ